MLGPLCFTCLTLVPALNGRLRVQLLFCRAQGSHGRFSSTSVLGVSFRKFVVWFGIREEIWETWLRVALPPAAKAHLCSGSPTSWESLPWPVAVQLEPSVSLRHGLHLTCAVFPHAVSSSVFLCFLMWKPRPREVTSFAGKNQGVNLGLLVSVLTAPLWQLRGDVPLDFCMSSPPTRISWGLHKGLVSLPTSPALCPPVLSLIAAQDSRQNHPVQLLGCLDFLCSIHALLTHL